MAAILTSGIDGLAEDRDFLQSAFYLCHEDDPWYVLTSLSLKNLAQFIGTPYDIILSSGGELGSLKKL